MMKHIAKRDAAFINPNSSSMRLNYELKKQAVILFQKNQYKENIVAEE